MDDLLHLLSHACLSVQGHQIVAPLTQPVQGGIVVPLFHLAVISELWRLRLTISVTFRKQQSDKHGHFSQPLAMGLRRCQSMQDLNFSLKLSFTQLLHHFFVRTNDSNAIP